MCVCVFRCALHATLRPPRPTSQTPSPCSPSCGRLSARAEAEAPQRRCLWPARLLMPPSGPPRPQTSSPCGSRRPPRQDTTHSTTTTTTTCTRRPRGRPSRSPATASKHPSFQPCTARDEIKPCFQFNRDFWDGHRGGKTPVS